MRYRVDNLPWLWRPVWLIYSWLVGVGWWVFLRLLHSTCRVRIEGREHPSQEQSVIYSLWHRFWPVWFVAFIRSHRRHAWMQHPAAYMKPVHISLQLMGIRILLGSGGEEGREAAAMLAGLLRQGWSTVISPDGPGGPPQVLKKGILHIAADSGVPVVPVRLEAKPAIRLRSWDRKVVPLPFARVRVVFGQPLRVRKENLAEAAAALSEAMSEGLPS